MKPLALLDLFSGIGGFSLGLERTGGFKTVAFCEIEEFPRRVLAKHWPKVPCYHDIRELTADRLAADGIAVDVVAGGFPCQDVSNAGAVWGLCQGLEGSRSGLWSECARLVGELRPGYAVFENVDALLGNGLARVLRDLASIGYDAEWHCIRASSLRLPQPRPRVWIVAYPSEKRDQRLITSEDISLAGQRWEGRPADLQSIANAPFQRGNSRPAALFRGVDDRPANWVDRVGACGNAVVPQIPELIGRAILASRAQERAAA